MKRNCQEILSGKVGQKERDDKLEEVKMLGNLLSSWFEVQGHQGLCLLGAGIFRKSHGRLEPAVPEYGDYLALNPSKLKTEPFKRPVWHQKDGMSWLDVATRLQRE